MDPNETRKEPPPENPADKPEGEGGFGDYEGHPVDTGTSNPPPAAQAPPPFPPPLHGEPPPDDSQN